VDANHRPHGFVRRPSGTFVSFDVPASTQTSPLSINNAGAVTGFANGTNGLFFGFVRDPQGKFTSFNPGFYTFPRSINNEGAIAGYFQPTNGAPYSGFVRSPGGTITSFIPPFCAGSIQVGAVFVSSNDKGVATGYCTADVGRNSVGWVRVP